MADSRNVLAALEAAGLTTTGVAAPHAVLFERIGAIASAMEPDDRAGLLGWLNDPETAAQRAPLERSGATEALRVALGAVQDGCDPVDALHGRAEAVRRKAEA